MVAIIKTGYSLKRSFYYNENKLEQNGNASDCSQIPSAELLSVANYPMDLSAMNQQQRLNMLLKTAERNPDNQRNSVHISLNFAPGEQLENEKLKAIAGEYMEAIGFGDQPYIVYRHHDAGHPHIHIVTTNVQASGKAIRMYNIGKLLSEPARRDIEKRHGLVAADDHKRSLFRLKPIPVERVVYGKGPTKNAIANVLTNILERYKYTSLSELNAVLNIYNVHADPGAESSRIRKNNGLQFRLLDINGKPVGAPIKASHFYLSSTVIKRENASQKNTVIHNSPTQSHLEKNFRKNKLLRGEHATSLKLSIDSLLRKFNTLTPEKFSAHLKSQGIHVLQRRNSAGRLYGITYVDHRSKCVFNGSDLGKEYSANAIASKLTSLTIQQNGTGKSPLPIALPLISQEEVAGEKSLWDILTEPTYEATQAPFPLRSHRKKKRKNKRNNNNQ